MIQKSKFAYQKHGDAAGPDRQLARRVLSGRFMIVVSFGLYAPFLATIMKWAPGGQRVKGVVDGDSTAV